MKTASQTQRAAMLFLAILMSGMLLVQETAAAASTPPPPASNLVVAHRYDHTLVLTFAVPAAFYHPGAGAVVRLTAGYTPAASPTEGYAVPLAGRTVTARPLTAHTVYTFAVWIRDAGVFSARRTVSSATLADVTGPTSLRSIEASVLSTTAATPAVTLTFRRTGSDPDLAGVRIVRNIKPTTAGGNVTKVSGDGITYSDSSAHQSDTRYYYWAIPYDTSGHYAAHYAGTSILMNTRRISGTYSPSIPEGGPAGAVAFNANRTRVDTQENYVDEGSQKWHMDLPPGKYTVCEYAPDNPPDLHFHPVPACVFRAPNGTYGSLDWVTHEFPEGTQGAVDTTSGPVSGVNISISYY